MALNMCFTSLYSLKRRQGARKCQGLTDPKELYTIIIKIKCAEFTCRTGWLESSWNFKSNLHRLWGSS